MGRRKEVVEPEEVSEDIEKLKVKNDQEWQFFDTARVNVNAGTGGNG